VLDAQGQGAQPLMLTEFGGIAFSPDPEHTWGYSRVRSAEEFAARYAELLQVVRCLPLFAGFCYTQFADTYQEANGLLYADRRPKIPLGEIARATHGPHSRRDSLVESSWQERPMNLQRSQYTVPAEDYRMQNDR
jgi:hypothetical protein